MLPLTRGNVWKSTLRIFNTFQKTNRKAGEISNACAKIESWKDMHTDVNRVTLSR